MTNSTHTDDDANREPRDGAEDVTKMTPQQRAAHDESLAKIRDLEHQVEQVEQREGYQIPSQPGADETVATGL
ncbi:MAG: hypothetical protein H0X37_14905 [Herpetosiphonaceae bacterium]|nr:hypothetical protein [Herpetosiphonaceae bacterium]